jgi:hypothetical protein
MATMPQTTGFRLWPVIRRRRGLPSAPQVDRITASEAEVLARVGERARRERESGSAAGGRIVRPRWLF